MPGRTGARGEPSRKRMRHDADDEEEIIEVTSGRANSSRRNNPGKRARISEAGPSKRSSDHAVQNQSASDDDENEIEDEDEDMADAGSAHEPSPPPATQYEDIRDNGFEHLQHEQEDDLRATQRIKSRPALVGDNHAAENGILESVTCVNFMCHERLHCELGPLLNFIVGENGSGKSAILTAITLCLGGKASSTNRGGSLKAFVKEGKDQGLLSVKIKNQGIDAYQHDIYGDSIIVERHFSKTGTSGFKVKSHAGRTISSKRNEVSEIVEYFCLQVDNPLNVLSQDNARQFLNASSDAQKYKFFVEGVQLEQLDTDYRLIMEFLESSMSKLPEQEERVQVTKQASDKAQKLLESIRQNKELRRQRRLYGQQLAWSQVQDQENILKEREALVSEGDARILEAQRTAEESAELFVAADEKHDRQTELLQNIQEEEGGFTATVDAANEAFQKAKKDLEKVRGEERDAHQKANNAKAQLRDNEEKIEEEKRAVAGAHGAALAAKQRELQEANSREAELKQDTAENNTKLREFQEQAEAANQEHNKGARAVDAKQKEVVAMEAKLRTLEQSTGSPYDGYHRLVPQLVQQIANDRGFKDKPIGPIGSMIRVLKPQWTSILEATLGGILNGFIVTNFADQKRLQSRIRQLGIDDNIPILIGNRRLLNTQGHEPEAAFDTIMRVLRFEDDIVRNQLIINSSIEQILLIEARGEAEKVMFSGPAPRNVKACLCMHDIKRGQGLRLTNRHGGSSISTAAVVPGNRRLRMKSDMQSQISEQREVVAQLRADLQTTTRQRDTHRRKLREAEDEVRQRQRKIQELANDLRRCQGAIRGIQEELDSFEGYDERLQSLEAARETLQEDFERCASLYGSINASKQEQSRKVEELKAKLDEEKTHKRDFTARLAKQTRNVEMAKDARLVALTRKNQDFEEVDKRKDDKRQNERRLRDQQETVERFTAEASKIVAQRVYVPEGETFASIQKKLEKLSEALDAREKRIGKTDEEVGNEAAAARHEYEQARQAYRGSSLVIRNLKQTMDVRLDKWRLFQRYISSSARANFLYLLSERGYRGQLLLDHVNKKLQVQVEPDATRKNATGRNTKTLSGGEKSFSSICLLLAIWDSMGSPLRCLDEFDVFMDNVNRAISTNMLVSAARKSVGRQYIMITPNAIEGRAKVERDVKIIRMTDPRQRTLHSYH